MIMDPKHAINYIYLFFLISKFYYVTDIIK